MTPTLLLLFDYDWDQLGLAKASEGFALQRAGFDLFSFPNNAHLAFFDIDPFTDKLARKIRRQTGAKVEGVLSAHEQFGALAAAILAEKLGLPGTSPTAIARCQHKFALRQLIDQVAPEANPRYSVLPCRYGEPIPDSLHYPLFVKPIKAAYSVLARVCHSRQELADLLKFSWPERWIIEHLVEPFERVSKRLLPEVTVSAHRMLMEEPIVKPQFNLDGYVYQGKAHLLGIVDELMYPDTQAFLRFAFPSKLAPQVQARAFDLAQKVLAAAEFTHGFFNIEFFFDAATDRLTIIEINPRLGSQLADLYQRTLGLDVYKMVIALALGKDPAQVPRLATDLRAAASFVFRTFGDEHPPSPPSHEHYAWLREFDPQALLLSFAKDKMGLNREKKWLGSHRYATLNMAARNEDELRRRYEIVCQRLAWPAPY